MWDLPRPWLTVPGAKADTVVAPLATAKANKKAAAPVPEKTKPSSRPSLLQSKRNSILSYFTRRPSGQEQEQDDEGEGEGNEVAEEAARAEVDTAREAEAAQLAEEAANAPPRPKELLEQPSVRISHNNQTGKWLTLFRAKWTQNAEVYPHFSIGNMKRYLDVYDADGTLLKQLYDPEAVTAVPAVTAAHPRALARIATGNASGRCYLWAPPLSG